MSINLFSIAVISFFITYFGVYFIIPILRKYSLQNPNKRGSHFSPKPTGAGIVFAIVITFSLVFLDNKISLICLPLALIGFLDDLFNLKKSIRYFAQVLTVIFMLNEYQFINSFLGELSLIMYILVSLFLIFCCTAIINFTNFMDGIDGLISSCFIIIFTIAAIKVDPSLWIVVASLIGFLLLNWHPSKIFMGDVGSTFLGALLAAVLLKSNLYNSLMVLVVALPLFLDAFVCVIRRFSVNEPIFKAHSLHLYQRLFQAGLSHSKISLIYSISSALLAGCVLLDMINLLIPTIIVIISFGIILDRFVAISFAESIKNFKKLI